ncbi:MAG TPA: anti-sigma factor [Actinoplanes sp.]|nr:anti-sigma factor [Actinoplanes sp.]
MSEDVHALVGAYALDALDDLERMAFSRHLRECEPCRVEAAELQETVTRLADGAWSVPPPSLRDSVLAEIATTRQIAPAGPEQSRRNPKPRRLRLVAAAAAVVAVVGAGAAVWTVQDQRVRQAETLAEQARTSESRLRSILAAPDLVVREQRLTSGGRVTMAMSRLRDAGVVTLVADGAPGSDRVYQLWTIHGETPSSAGAMAVGQSTMVQVVEGLSGTSAIGVTVEPAPGSTTPTSPADALLKII